MKDEQAHRELHRKGECDPECETYFDPEDRERRQRPRSGKGKGKAKDVMRDQAVQVTQAAGVVGEPNFGYGIGQGHRHNTEERSGVQTPFPAEASRQAWAPEAEMAAYQYFGYRTTGGVPSQAEMVAAMAHVEQGHGFPENGWAPRSMLWHGQMMMGQPGAGMKWYPQSQATTMPNLPPVPTSPYSGHKRYNKAPRVWQKAMSEPTEPSTYLGSPAATLSEMCPHFDTQESKFEAYEAPTFSEQVEYLKEPHEPIIVSSDMGRRHKPTS
jgi:hypothetical protein